ncbi:MAG TPA: hypothetical protein VF297_25645 [Pyrinomonadaceae bacterium]
MNKAQTRILGMLYSVRQHGLSRTAAFPANSRGHELYAAVDTSIKNIERYAATQAQHARALKEKTAQRKIAFEVLRQMLGAISRTARSMSPSTPGMEERFRLPSNREAQTWLATARAFVTEAESLAEEFIRRGMSPGFVDDLKARILAFEQSTDGQAQKSAEQVAATASLAEAAEQGLAAVRELGAIVLNIYADNDAERAAWESASHVERAPRREEEEAPEPAPETAKV